ncbi:MAG: AbrB/MazE/SpoVT family DNA-binding domain-containing protein [archaeon]
MEKETVCLECNGIAELKYEEISLDNGRIIIKDAPYYKCKSCGDEFVTSEQMYDLDKRIHKNFSFKRNVIATGRSLAITLPFDIVEQFGINKGTIVNITPEQNMSLKISFENSRANSLLKSPKTVEYKINKNKISTTNAKKK